MDKRRLDNLLESVASGEVTCVAAAEQLKTLPYADLDFAKVDLHRGLRQGIPEVIYCPGKTASQIVDIATNLKQNGSTVVTTRASEEIAQEVMSLLPEAVYHPLARMIVWGSEPIKNVSKVVGIVTAGTADLPVAEEAATFLTVSGYRVQRINDVGVAGIHRLFANLDLLLSMDVVIVVAGMDGALPSVVGGIVSVPVIAVPTSVGYGSSFDGLAALLSMLNSCAAGLTVVNIDNGFGAAVAAIRILMMHQEKQLAAIECSSSMEK
jgi:pyridinium-3,5-biscarboxylic acid mononucleotide synthase